MFYHFHIESTLKVTAVSDIYFRRDVHMKTKTEERGVKEKIL